LDWRYDLNRLCWPMELSWMVWFILGKTIWGGRAGESASHGVTEDLIAAGFESGRMKTGTPPRVDGRSLDYSKMKKKRRCQAG
jgi:tRNA U34 5-carboxymethylaminomethyl modifying enzyme MnmG/GidA